jgi:hypothetical protein
MNKQSRIAPAGFSSPSPTVGKPATPHGALLANECAEGEAGGFSPVPSVSPTSIDAIRDGSGTNRKSHGGGLSQTGGAGASNAPTFHCRECDGEGEAQYLALDETEYRWRTCHVCEGSRVEAPYCEICSGKLTCDLYCSDCDEWASLTYVDRISPTRVAL